MAVLTHGPFVRLHHLADGSTQTLEVIVNDACAKHTSAAIE